MKTALIVTYAASALVGIPSAAYLIYARWIRKPHVPQPRAPPAEKKRLVKFRDISDNDLYVPAGSFYDEFAVLAKDWKARAKFYRKNKGKICLIRMELGNGQFREFLAVDESGYFIWNKRLFVFDYSQKYYLIERDLWCYDFNENVSLPIRKSFYFSEKLEKEIGSLISQAQAKIDAKARKNLNARVDVNELRNLIENTDLVDVEASFNPLTLKRFTDSEVIKQVLQGAMLSKFFKLMFAIIVILAVLALLTFIITVYQSGIIQDVVAKFAK